MKFPSPPSLDLARRIAAALLSLLPLTGCTPKSSAPAPGVSVPLAYPVLLIGQRSLDVRDSEEELISIRGASSLNLMERVLLDSEGRLFAVARAEPAAGAKPILLDMGTSPRRHAVEIRERPKPSFAEIRSLVLEQVSDPASVWAGDPRAVEKVRSLSSVGELIEACREAWNWMR